MIVSVKVNHLKNVLRDAKNQCASVAIRSRTGESSNEYFHINEVKDVFTERGVITIVILHSEKDLRCALMDVRLIKGLRFNKYLTVKGVLTDEIVVLSDVVQHHSIELR
jgi:hypothetical protein